MMPHGSPNVFGRFSYKGFAGFAGALLFLMPAGAAATRLLGAYSNYTVVTHDLALQLACSWTRATGRGLLDNAECKMSTTLAALSRGRLAALCNQIISNSSPSVPLRLHSVGLCARKGSNLSTTPQ